MTNILSIPGVKVSQKDYHQIIIRGNGLEKFNNTIEEKTSIKPPSKNLEVKYDLNYIFAKNSFDQWSLVCLEKQSDKEMLRLISAMNANEKILASDYSNTLYFEFTGKNKDHYLSKLTHFDLRPKRFPVSTVAQTLIARIDCCLYHLQDKYLLTCHSSFEDYFKDRLQDAINL